MAKETSNQAEQDLQNQIEQLRKELKDIASTLSTIGSQKINKAKTTAENLLSSAKENGEETLDEAKEKIQNIEQQLCTCVRKRPAASLAVAAGIGFVLALVLRK